MSTTYAEWERDRTCTSKRVYGHQLAAREEILAIAKRGGPDMSEYRCPHCQLWHLTTQTGDGGESSTAAIAAQDPKRTPSGRDAREVTPPSPHTEETA